MKKREEVRLTVGIHGELGLSITSVKEKEIDTGHGKLTTKAR